MQVKQFSGDKDFSLFNRLIGAGLGLHSPSDPGVRPHALPVHNVAVDRALRTAPVERRGTTLHHQHAGLGVTVKQGGAFGATDGFPGVPLQQIFKNHNEMLPDGLQVPNSNFRSGNVPGSVLGHLSKHRSDVFDDDHVGALNHMVSQELGNRHAISLMPDEVTGGHPTQQR